MKLSNSNGLERKLLTLKKKSPWFASLIQHCLQSENPKAFEAMRMLLARLRLNTV